jgi:hypothetical protein
MRPNTLIKSKISNVRRKAVIWVGTGHLVFLLFASGAFGVYSLRQNNIQALKLYDKVIKADKYDGDLNSSLTELQRFTSSHMNTQLRQPVQLVESYNRDALEIVKQNQDNTPENEAIYKEAQQECSRRGVPYTAIAECASNYALARIDPNYDPTIPITYSFPDQAQYTYSFASPYWTPDLAGVSWALFVFSFVILIFRVCLHLHASRVLKKRNRAKKS